MIPLLVLHTLELLSQELYLSEVGPDWLKWARCPGVESERMRRIRAPFYIPARGQLTFQSLNPGSARRRVLTALASRAGRMQGDREHMLDPSFQGGVGTAILP